LAYSSVVNHRKITLLQGDITTQDTEAIVNAASSELLGGGGVDGAIHQAAGHKLLEECKIIKNTNLQKTHGMLPTGQAVITEGYHLSARYIIHTVGPIYQNVDNPDKLLHNAYFNSLQLAEEYKISSIAFPSIGTGVYGCPIEWAAKIALSTIRAFLTNAASVNDVRMVLFSERDYEVYKHTLVNLVESKN
jgi:O-acetyl-ADP-ribose deacetylase